MDYGVYPMKWIKLKYYCAISGDSINAVHAKRRKGQWLDEVHCRIAPDGNLWINLKAVEQWIESTAIALDPARQA